MFRMAVRLTLEVLPGCFSYIKRIGELEAALKSFTFIVSYPPGFWLHKTLSGSLHCWKYRLRVGFFINDRSVLTAATGFPSRFFVTFTDTSGVFRFCGSGGCDAGVGGLGEGDGAGAEKVIPKTAARSSSLVRTPISCSFIKCPRLLFCGGFLPALGGVWNISGEELAGETESMSANQI